ncbi:MAG: hypothetical protein ABI895_42580 [Deltaproteobacteria bacterium]
MGVADRFIDLMLRTSSRDLDTPSRSDMQSSLSGWAPEIEEWLIAQCDTVGDREADARWRALRAQGDTNRAGVQAVNRELCFDRVLEPERTKRRASQK